MIQKNVRNGSLTGPFLFGIVTVLIILIQLNQLIQFKKENSWRGRVRMYAGSSQRKGGSVIILDYKDRRPLYEQVAERFRELIIRGVLPADMQMPSVRSQAMELSINPNTIQRAYSQLEQQGYIYSIKGKGSFVADIGGIMKEQREQWKADFARLAEEGFAFGVSLKEMEAILEKTAGGYAKGTGKEGGNGND